MPASATIEMTSASAMLLIPGVPKASIEFVSAPGSQTTIRPTITSRNWSSRSAPVIATSNPWRRLPVKPTMLTAATVTTTPTATICSPAPIERSVEIGPR